MLPRSLHEARKLIRVGSLSAKELTVEIRDRAYHLNAQFNAYVSMNFDESIAQAQALDQLDVDQKSGSLFGVPLALKDNIDLAGHPTTCGAGNFDTHPSQDARVTALLKKQNALVVGKNNLHEFAWGGTTANRNFGAVLNPWDPTRICHGSSGGSAAAVAAGMCFGALGTDTGTSIRHPSAVTGLTGLRPTLGAIPLDGVFPLALTMDTVGPMALNARDCGIIFDALEPRVRPSGEFSHRSLKGMRLGVVNDFSLHRADPAITRQLEQALNALVLHGAEVIEIEIPALHDFFECWIILHTVEPAIVHQHLLNDPTVEYSPDVRVMLEGASQISATDYLFAQQWRSFIVHTVQETYRQYNLDAIVTPTAPRVAHAAGIPEANYIMGRVNLNNNDAPFSGVASLLGFPSITVPMGLVEELPTGMQFMALPHFDRLLVHLATLYQEITEWHLLTRNVWDRY